MCQPGEVAGIWGCVIDSSTRRPSRARERHRGPRLGRSLSLGWRFKVAARYSLSLNTSFHLWQSPAQTSLRPFLGMVITKSWWFHPVGSRVMAPSRTHFCPDLGQCYAPWQRGVQVAHGIDAGIQMTFKEGGFSDGPIISTGSLQVQEGDIREAMVRRRDRHSQCCVVSSAGG